MIQIIKRISMVFWFLGILQIGYVAFSYSKYSWDSRNCQDVRAEEAALWKQASAKMILDSEAKEKLAKKWEEEDDRKAEEDIKKYGKPKFNLRTETITPLTEVVDITSLPRRQGFDQDRARCEEAKAISFDNEILILLISLTFLIFNYIITGNLIYPPRK